MQIFTVYKDYRETPGTKQWTEWSDANLTGEKTPLPEPSLSYRRQWKSAYLQEMTNGRGMARIERTIYQEMGEHGPSSDRHLETRIVVMEASDFAKREDVTTPPSTTP